MNRIRVVHLADDLSKGGVANGLKLFEQPVLAKIAQSQTVKIDPHHLIAPALKADVIITHFPPRWKCLPFLFSLRLRNPSAAIIHVEHSYCREWEQLYVKSSRRFRTMLRLACRAYDTVVAVSKAQAGWLLATKAIDAKRLRIIYPYSRDQVLRSVLPLQLCADAPLIVGSYGRFCNAKGYERLIAAFKSLPPHENIRLMLGGMGPLEESLRQLAAGCDSIEFVGEVKDTAAFMEKIHVFAVPSRYETYGQVASEAREAGRPILVSTAGGLPEQVGDAGIIVDCDDPDALLNALRSLRTLPLQQMGRNGRADVQLCIQNRIASWQILLQSCLKQKGRLYPKALNALFATPSR
jgi:glycosyltransferase involved in cell wall biosynthesis